MLTESKTYKIENYLIEDLTRGKVNLDDLISGNLHGFVLENFLSQDEVGQILNGFRSLNHSELVHINPAFNSYPMSFAQFDQMVRQGKLTEEGYFDFSKEYVLHFKNKFGVDIHSKLKSIFGSIVNSPQLEIPQNVSKSGAYVPFTFRELFAGEGCLKAHCENLFFQEFPGFFEKINAFSIPEDQLSFFIVLQTPGEGGELTLFDILWHNNQRRPNDDEVILENGERIAFDDTKKLKRDYLLPITGSLVVFSGGKIWHRVEKVSKAPSRITLGGFLSFSHDRSKLYTWS